MLKFQTKTYLNDIVRHEQPSCRSSISMPSYCSLHLLRNRQELFIVRLKINKDCSLKQWPAQIVEFVCLLFLKKTKVKMFLQCNSAEEKQADKAVSTLEYLETTQQVDQKRDGKGYRRINKKIGLTAKAGLHSKNMRITKVSTFPPPPK